MDLYNEIFVRKSVRKYVMESLPDAVLTQIQDIIGNLHPLIPGIKTHIEIGRGQDINGLLAVKAPYYALFYSEEAEGYLYNAGFMMQQLDLALSAMGLGRCWIGMSKAKTRNKDNMIYIAMLAFGTTTVQKRTSIEEFKRKPLAEISNGEDPRLQAARLTPSAQNMQPWFFHCENGSIAVGQRIHGALKTALFQKWNQLDMGIALCHLWLASEAANLPFSFSWGKQSAQLPQDFRCIGILESPQ